MIAETLLPSKNLIIASFEAQQDAEQVYETLQILRRDGQRDVNAFLVTNRGPDGIQSKLLLDNLEFQSTDTTTIKELPKLIEENEVIGELIRSLSPTSSVLMVIVGNDESSAVMVTFLAIIMAGTES